VGAEVSVSARAFADDLNTQAASGYGVVALKAGRGFKSGGIRWYAWGRLDNLFDRVYAGSLIINDSNGRFYESAAGRRLTVGLRGQFD
jgi:iron complex outermembrane receptor protein